MWTIYDIRRNRYWNEQRDCWCDLDEATRYTVRERDEMMLPSVTLLWKFVPAASQLRSAIPATSSRW